MIKTTYIGLVSFVYTRELGEDAMGSPDLLGLKCKRGEMKRHHKIN